MAEATPSLKRSAQPSPLTTVEEMKRIFDLQREAFLRAGPPSYEERVEDLKKLQSLIRDHSEEIVEAVIQDFGSRSWHETISSEVILTLSHLRYTLKHLKSWMKPKPRKVSWMYFPARAGVIYQPRGVAGIIAPWNYPFYLIAVPLTSALAAGNRVMIKPSEITPRVAELTKRLLEKAFPEEKVAVILGDVEVGQAFSRLPFDVLLFTGSTSVGRMIMRSASENLTPVILELGGKSPTIVHPDYPLDHAVSRILTGKFLNAGQTCVAPDYVFVHEGKLDAFVDRMVQLLKKAYPTIRDNPDYTAIVNDRHYHRLLSYIEDAREKGAKIIEVNPAGEEIPPSSRKIPPTLILQVREDMRVMQEEIFGPLLPILPYRDLEEVIEFVNRRPRPLALYYFDDDKDRVRWMLERTFSGGVSVNETTLHVAQDDLPFGGIGESGLGAYHGFEGFEAFSHKKGVFYQSRLAGARFLHPPFNETMKKILRWLVQRM
jgi:coniferyl-aldehyde dehydrogenase